MTIRNPVEWGSETFRQGTHAVNTGGHAIYHQEDINSLVPKICRIDTADLRNVIRKGLEDFGVYRTDVIFLCLIYPVVGLVWPGPPSAATCCNCCFRWRPASR